MTDIEDKERKLAAKTFASFKFEMIDAMMVDDRLSPSDFKVAVALLQMLNGKSGELYPSQAVIADITRIAERTVRDCLAKLKATGWIDWHRGNRQLANDYSFDTANKAPMEAKRLAMEIKRREQKMSRKKAGSDRQPTAARAEARPVLTGSPLPLQTGSPLPPNTLMEHLSKRALI